MENDRIKIVARLLKEMSRDKAKFSVGERQVMEDAAVLALSALAPVSVPEGIPDRWPLVDLSAEQEEFFQGMVGQDTWDARATWAIRTAIKINRSGKGLIDYESAIEFAKHFSAPTVSQGEGGWMPIESAPKDGRPLLLGLFNSHGKWRTMRGEWITQEYIDEYWEEPENAEPGWHESAVESEVCWAITPTHWQPLPAAPKPQPTEQAKALKGEK